MNALESIIHLALTTPQTIPGYTSEQAAKGDRLKLYRVRKKMAQTQPKVAEITISVHESGGLWHIALTHTNESPLAQRILALQRMPKAVGVMADLADVAERNEAASILKPAKSPYY